jgi:iron(III) transport system ATP-binding protein
MNELNTVEVEIRGVSKKFPTQLALKGVDLRVPGGSFTTLLGPSGCGKTTLLRILAGFETATSGSVLFNGTDVATTPVWKRNIGFVFQNYALWPHMSVAGNIAYGLKLRKLPRAEIDERVSESLAMVGLADRADAFPGQLSGGQQQRVAIARAMALRPQVLLLDEPLSNLDAKMRVDMRHDLLRLQREVGITTIYVTHDQLEALEMSDHVAVMERGRVDQFGAPTEIYDTPTTSFVASFIGKVTLLDGVVTAAGEFLPELPLTSALPTLDPAPAAGPSRLVLRPENLELVAAGEGHFDGTVEQSVYHGAGYSTVLELPGGIVCEVEHRRAGGLQAGAAVGVRVLRATAVPASSTAAVTETRSAPVQQSGS